MQPFDIYRFSFPWAGCNDQRPWVIIDLRANKPCGCFPIASECYAGIGCFRIDREHEDFQHTGLTKTSFIHYGQVIAVPSKQVLLGSRGGDLRNALLFQFKYFANL